MKLLSSAMALAVAGTIVVVPGGGGVDAAPRRARMRWEPKILQLTALRGTSILAEATVESSLPADGLRIRVVPALEDFLTVLDDGFGSLGARESWTLPIVVAASAGTLAGNYGGTIQVRTDSNGRGGGRGLGLGRTVPLPLPVRLHVAEPTADFIPDGPSNPSPDRIVRDENGRLIVQDEVIVILEADTPDPEATIMAIAEATGGVFLGSIPAVLTYQIMYPVADLEELFDKMAEIRTYEWVEAAVPNFVSEDPPAVPNDPEYSDPWDEFFPAGDNYNFELTNALSAWDLQTGSAAVKVGIIDGHFDSTHVDLAANVGLYDTSSAAPGFCGFFGGHGTHVAGITGAVGNNAIGVTGMAWNTDLMLYELVGPTGWGCPTNLNVLNAMVEAVDDGVDIVNMSLGFVGTNNCAAPCDLITAALINQSLKPAMDYAVLQGQDVLWVFAAGNECKLANCQSPASITDLFPENTMTVAAVDSGANKAFFSNYGCLVSVGAPGVNILSTMPGDTYGTKSGTSMAAPAVAGLAALVKSSHPEKTAEDIKDCIRAAAGNFGAPVPPDLHGTHDFRTINAEEAVQCATTTVLPPEVDLIISVDLTGSMLGEIATLKIEINDALNEIIAQAPGTFFRFGVVTYEDYTGNFDSSPCPDSNYQSTYGGVTPKGPDEAFRIDQPLTTNLLQVQNTIQNLQSGWGGDGPQSYGRVYWELGQADTALAMGYSPTALQVVLDFGDNLPHDPDLNEGVFYCVGGECTGGSKTGDPCVTRDDCAPGDPAMPWSFWLRGQDFDTGYDPGRNDVINCGGDDIDFQGEALPAMVSRDVRLVHVDSSDWCADPDTADYWQAWASQTGGSFRAIRSDGVITGDELCNVDADCTAAVGPGSVCRSFSSVCGLGAAGKCTVGLSSFILELLESVPVCP